MFAGCSVSKRSKSNGQRNVYKTETSFTVSLENSTKIYLKIKLPYDTAILLLCFYPKES